MTWCGCYKQFGMRLVSLGSVSTCGVYKQCVRISAFCWHGNGVVRFCFCRRINHVRQGCLCHSFRYTSLVSLLPQPRVLYSISQIHRTWQEIPQSTWVGCESLKPFQRSRVHSRSVEYIPKPQPGFRKPRPGSLVCIRNSHLQSASKPEWPVPGQIQAIYPENHTACP